MHPNKNTIAGNRIPISEKPPKHLTKVAAEVWRDTLKKVSSAGYQIDALDTEAFTAFCSAAATIRDCDALIEKDGLCVDGGREGVKRHPAASVKNSALTQLRAYASSLGLTASSRARLPAEFQPEEENEFAQFDEEPKEISRQKNLESTLESLRKYQPEVLAAFVAEHGREPNIEDMS